MIRSIGILFLLCGVLFGTEYIVDIDGSGDYTDIQSAIDAASNGDEIEVYPGTYTIDEPIDFRGKSLWLHSRDGYGTTIVQMSNPESSSNACVVKIANEEDAPTLEGFTIRGGEGVLVSTKYRGGGVYVNGADPEIIDCNIDGNKADFGAGIYIASTPSNDRAEIQGCTIRQNVRLSSEDGEAPYAIYAYNACVTIADCDIGVNDGDNYGGGIYGNSSAVTIEDSTIEDNEGHGISIEDSNTETVSISRCLIWYNSLDGDDIGAIAHGGGIYLNNSSPTIDRCKILSNYISPASFLSAHGGGICCYDESSPTITNCLIYGNSTDDGYGGGIACLDGSEPTIMNCTIRNNSATDGYAVYSTASSYPEIKNSILMGDWRQVLGAAEITYSCIEDADSGDWLDDADWNNIAAANVHFVSSTDSHLVWDPDDEDDRSACIDAGTSTGAPNNDLDGRARPAASCHTDVDMGCYKFTECDEFVRGDANDDGSITIADAIAIPSNVVCWDAADANDDGVVNTLDATYIVNYLFYSGPDPKPPFPSLPSWDCGLDPTGDSLTFGEYTECD